MKAGQTVRFECEFCGVEFEVQLEPNYAEDSGIEDKSVGYCPFCGESNIVELG